MATLNMDGFSEEFRKTAPIECACYLFECLLVYDSKTFILNKDEEEDSVSVLSIYTAMQKDIFNILPIGKKHDMIIVPQLE